MWLLGLRSYAKGTMDDVTIFVVPLKQIFEYTKLNQMSLEQQKQEKK